MRILRPLFHLAVIGLIVFAVYYFLIFPMLTVKAKVVHMYDPDSLLVLQDGVMEKVQLIGVDAPEMGGAERNIWQCYHREAEKQAAQLFAVEREVALETDDTLGDRDEHGRLLRYVRLADGQMLNEVLLREGLAKEFHMDDSSYGKSDHFQSLEKEAKEADLGIWDECGGGF